MKKIISAAAALAVCSGIICLTAGSTNVIDDISKVTREDVGALMNEDFYTYVNFEQFRDDVIPYNEEYNDVAKDWTEDARASELMAIINSAHEYGSNEQKIADLYEQFMDVDSRNSDGISALLPAITKIEDAADIDQLAEVFCELNQDYGTSTIMHFFLFESLWENPKKILYLKQISMPVEAANFFTEYGLADKLQKTVRSVIEYRDGENSAERARNTIDMLMEIGEYSELSYKLEESAEYIEDFKIVSLSQLSDMFTADISPYINMIKSHGMDSIVLMNPDEFAKAAELFTNENLQAWKDYAVTQLLFTYYDFLPEETALLFNPISGAPQKADEYNTGKMIFSEMAREFDFIFASEYGDDDRIEAAREFAADFIKAYGEMIKNSSDVDAATKAGFLKKLEKCQVCIDIPREPYDGGYEWIPSSKGGSLLKNMVNKKKVTAGKAYDSVGTYTDLSAYSWDSMPSYTFNNACYHESNFVTIPYASICEPFFSPDGDMAKNLGYLGACLGHELSHGFDSNGMKFDDDGNYRPDWISEDYSKVLEQKKADIIEIYNAQKLFGIYPVDGELTLSENMADIAGLQCAVSMGRNTAEKRAIFEEYAKSWYMMFYDSVAYDNLYIDVHAVNEFRVNVVVSQLDEFYEAFDVTSGKMYTAPENRRRVW